MKHHLACINEAAQLHTSVRVWQFATIGEGTIIGADTVIGSCVYVGRFCRIGRGCRLNHGVFLPNGSVLEDEVFIGPNVTFTDDRYPRANNPGYKAEPPVIGKGAAIGAGAVILPGIKIGAGALIGAGAVVTKDVEAQSTIIGNPGKLHYAFGI